MPPCPFCTLPPERIVHANALAVAVRDAYPVSPGHTLVIPRRHVGSFFELSAAERDAVMALLALARDDLLTMTMFSSLSSSSPAAAGDDTARRPDGFNVGINDGAAAGQTVPHVHVHLIPRFAGDRADPRGGVRWVMPERARYWP